MDGKRFDAVTRGLAVASSRRRVLGGLLAGVVIVQTGTAALAAKRGNRKRRRNDDGADDGAVDETLVVPGTLAGGIWEETIEVCRFDPESGGYDVIAVSPTAIPEHLNGGGTLFLDCCVDTDCEVRVCLTATGCIEGACAYDNTAGAPCDPGDGTTGVCGDEGICKSVAVAPPVGVG